jgi:RNA recognition motif-containing protein
MTKRFYVGNLPYKATENEVAEVFSVFGTVGEVSLIKDKETGKAKGFGFVDIETESDISNMTDLVMSGRVLKVDNARERKPRA